MKELEGKKVLITGGTGSLGQSLVKRILSGEMGTPADITVFSRDEAKQHYMRLDFLDRVAATDDIIYQNSRSLLKFRIGDIRDYSSILSAMRDVDILFHAAALKQVPSCEYFPYEAFLTNVMGSQNIVRAIRENSLPTSKVVGVSTDKACKPINVMGMTKALQERILLEANRHSDDISINCVRYGNVIASRGSIVPLFVEQIQKGQAVTITLPEMTRFLISLDRAVDTVFEAVRSEERGATFVPKAPAARMTDVAKALMGDKDVPVEFTGIRPGEKIHEIMVSEEECFRTIEANGYYVILPMLPELRENRVFTPALSSEYTSKDDNISIAELRGLLMAAGHEIASVASHN